METSPSSGTQGGGNRVSEELNSVETGVFSPISLSRSVVSEELNSVETGIHRASHNPASGFQKNLIVWKPNAVSCATYDNVRFRRT